MVTMGRPRKHKPVVSDAFAAVLKAPVREQNARLREAIHSLINNNGTGAMAWAIQNAKALLGEEVL